MQLPSRRPGFTLIEIMLVTVIIGLMLTVILPRGIRAMHAAKFNQVRMAGTEIAGYIIQWAESQAQSQPGASPYTINDYLSNTIDPGKTGIASQPLVGNYTGNNAFQPLARSLPAEQMPTNPFNEASYFSPVNGDDGETISRKPGMLYLTSGDESYNGGAVFRSYYLIFTDEPVEFGKGRWQNGMDKGDNAGMRRGIFVSRQQASKPTEQPVR